MPTTDPQKDTVDIIKALDLKYESVPYSEGYKVEITNNPGEYLPHIPMFEYGWNQWHTIRNRIPRGVEEECEYLVGDGAPTVGWYVFFLSCEKCEKCGEMSWCGNREIDSGDHYFLQEDKSLRLYLVKCVKVDERRRRDVNWREEGRGFRCRSEGGGEKGVS